MLAATHSGTAQVCYFNNAVIASASITETPSCLGASFGGGDDTNPNNWHGALYFQAFWNRALTAAEIASLNANPWQLFAPRRIYIPTAAAAAGAPTITALSAIGITATSAQPRITYA
jgi:hypothetical protein